MGRYGLLYDLSFPSFSQYGALDRQYRTLSSQTTFSESERRNYVLFFPDISAHPPYSGSYATVRLAFDTRTQRQVACKTIRLRPKSVPLRESADLSLATRESEQEHAKARRQLVMKEAQVLRNLKHVRPRLYLSIVCQAKPDSIDFCISPT